MISTPWSVTPASASRRRGARPWPAGSPAAGCARRRPDRAVGRQRRRRGDRRRAPTASGPARAGRPSWRTGSRPPAPTARCARRSRRGPGRTRRCRRAGRRSTRGRPTGATSSSLPSSLRMASPGAGRRSRSMISSCDARSASLRSALAASLSSIGPKDARSSSSSRPASWATSRDSSASDRLASGLFLVGLVFSCACVGGRRHGVEPFCARSRPSVTRHSTASAPRCTTSGSSLRSADAKGLST